MRVSSVYPAGCQLSVAAHSGGVFHDTPICHPRRERDDRRPITGWVGEGEIAVGIPTTQPVYWLQESVATWVCPDADYGTNLSKLTIHGSIIRQRYAAGDILPVRAGYICADRMIWWPVDLGGAVMAQWCSEGEPTGICWRRCR